MSHQIWYVGSSRNTSYIESNNDRSLLTEDENLSSEVELSNGEEHTPQLFSQDNESQAYHLL